MNAAQLVNGTSARVIKLSGTGQLGAKLSAMGIEPGSIILKKSSSILHGPIVIQKGPMQIAVGYKMAQRIVVEPVGE